MVRASQKKYLAKIRRFTVIFTESEKELYEYLQSKAEKSKYIKALIKQEMNK